MISFLLSILSWSYSLLLYTFLVVFPALAFDLGEKRIGLAFSLDLLLFYILTGFAALFCRSGSAKIIPNFLRSIEIVVIIGSFFHAFRHNTGGGRGSYFYAPYEAVLHFCGPLFTLLEGVASVLVIQALGVATRYCVQNWSENYQIVFLVLSAGVYVASFFSLYWVFQVSDLDAFTAAGIGAIVTFTLVLSFLALYSGRGVVTECALLLGYLTYCLYMIGSESPTIPVALRNETLAKQLPPLPDIDIKDFDTSVFVSQTTDFLRVAFRFLFAIISVVSCNAVIVLGYRLGILFSLSKIVPAMRSTEGEFDTDTLLDVNSMPTLLVVALSFAKAILLMVYTHLLLCHFGHIEGSNIFWQWVNLIVCLGLYLADMILGSEEGLDGVMPLKYQLHID